MSPYGQHLPHGTYHMAKMLAIPSKHMKKWGYRDGFWFDPNPASFQLGGQFTVWPIHLRLFPLAVCKHVD